MPPLCTAPRVVFQPLSTPQPQTRYETQNAPPRLLPARAMGSNLRHQRDFTHIPYLGDARQALSNHYKHRDLAEIWDRRVIETLLVAEKKIRPVVGDFAGGE